MIGLPAPLGIAEPRIRPFAVAGDPDDAQRDAVVGFLGAWLGRADTVSRWATGAALDVPPPSTHRDIAIGRLWLGVDQSTVIVVVSADDAVGLEVTYAMTLSLVDVDGALMISSVIPGAVPASSNDDA